MDHHTLGLQQRSYSSYACSNDGFSCGLSQSSIFALLPVIEDLQQYARLQGSTQDIDDIVNFIGPSWHREGHMQGKPVRAAYSRPASARS